MFSVNGACAEESLLITFCSRCSFHEEHGVSTTCVWNSPRVSDICQPKLSFLVSLGESVTQMIGIHRRFCFFFFLLKLYAVRRMILRRCSICGYPYRVLHFRVQTNLHCCYTVTRICGRRWVVYRLSFFKSWNAFHIFAETSLES